MHIKTVDFGELSIDPESILTFPQGIPGFENCTRYTLFHQENEPNPIVYWLQSVDDGAVAFSVGDPASFGIDYEFTLNDEELALLELEDATDALLLMLLYKDVIAGSNEMRSAIRAPLIINVKTRKGMQKVLSDNDKVINKENAT